MLCKKEGGSPEALTPHMQQCVSRMAANHARLYSAAPVAALYGRCFHRGAPFAHIKVHKLAVVLPCANQTGVLQGDKGMGNNCK